MKIAVCSQSNETNSHVDSRFGRAAFFAVYDDAVNQWIFVPNSQNTQAAQGAGIQAAQIIIDTGAEVLIASNVGPKAMAALKTNGIEIFKTNAGTSLQETLAQYYSENLLPFQEANVESHWT